MLHIASCFCADVCTEMLHAGLGHSLQHGSAYSCPLHARVAYGPAPQLTLFRLLRLPLQWPAHRVCGGRRVPLPGAGGGRFAVHVGRWALRPAGPPAAAEPGDHGPLRACAHAPEDRAPGPRAAAAGEPVSWCWLVTARATSSSLAASRSILPPISAAQAVPPRSQHAASAVHLHHARSCVFLLGRATAG